MNHVMRVFISVCLVSLTAVTGIASAANYTLWVNGRGGGGVIGNHNSFTYWGPATADAGVNKKSANWDGYNSIAAQNGNVRDALDCYCTGTNWCYVATHSAGDLMMGYALANYGGSSRLKKNAVPNSGGQCGNADGSSQTGWNIKWVRSAAGAAGGSELSDAGSWTTSEPLVKDLKTTTARAMYNHNTTYNVWFYMYAGAKGTAYSFILPGQDDEVVAYHSSGAAAGSGGSNLCNPGNWFCNDLTLGSGPNEGGSAKWNKHSVVFRDDNEAHNHYNSNNWQGVVGVMRAAVAGSAF
ncbi:hypothetical protein RBA41_18600 [Massilia sp. CCM 9210]|uniref:hypothetical protein n=1 Tax=Massilia scottii TaxID=3057166 RepID=UPI0027969BAB|nr:hypothetical protein [Massilia sp. CCM 9210]MDQ1815314.1 hypothetical protein [Massilia sp. CCM 9210]